MGRAHRSADDRALLTEFGRTVRANRERLDLSQEELADRSGLHRTYVGGVERGERNVGLINIGRLAKALETTPGRLLDGGSTGKA